MMINRVCSTKAPTDLVRLFSQRSGFGDSDAIQAIREHVSRVRSSAGLPSKCRQLQAWLPARGIDLPELVQGLHCDGYLEPKGRTYESGFRMVLRDGVGQARTRFTIAHEVCHTFFYQLVPEMKFSPHHTDIEEERLCNEGAAELLMPKDSIVAAATGSSESIQTLLSLASEYMVSMDAMLLRLRGIMSWHCELSVWHRMISGQFVLDRIRGAKPMNWRWVDESIIARAWEDPQRRSIKGRTAVDFQDDNGNEFARIVYFEAKRRGDSVIALWSKRRLGKCDTPLFQRSAKTTVSSSA